MNDLSNYKFIYGESFDDSNLYVFEDNGLKLYVSEKISNFIHGKSSRYLLFEICNKYNETYKEYISRDSAEYNNMSNIRMIIENIGGITVQCKNCKKIVLKEQITSMKNDKCIYCDKYACKKCRKIVPLIELDENRLCSRCRNSE